MWKELFSFFISLISLLNNLFFLISVPGISISSKTLQKFSWIKTKSNGEKLGIGLIYAGTNGFLIEGIDKDVIKYIDCKDTFKFCEICSKISTVTTFTIIICLLFSIITSILCFLSIFYEKIEHKRSIISLITLILSIITLTSFNNCYDSFKSSDGIENVYIRRGYNCVLYGLITSCFVTVFSISVKFFENYEMPTRSRTVYATNEEFEFEDIKNDAEFQANLD